MYFHPLLAGRDDAAAQGPLIGGILLLLVLAGLAVPGSP
jgi:hypothetical protein